MNNFDLWLVEIQKFEEGKLWFNNFEFDRQAGNLTPGTLSAVIKAFDSIRLTFTTKTDSLSIADALIKDFWSAVGFSASSFDLRCERSPRRTCQWYAFAIPVQAFLERYVDPARRKPGGSARRKSVPVSELLKRASNHIAKKEFRGAARTSRPFFWATRASNFRKLRKKFVGQPDELAREIRILAGLSHRFQGEGLVEVRIPRIRYKGKAVKAPSIFDAGYPSGAFIPSDDRKTGYGWALNLITYKKGLDEVVIEELEYDCVCDAEVIGIIPLDRHVKLDQSRLEKFSRTRLGLP